MQMADSGSFCDFVRPPGCQVVSVFASFLFFNSRAACHSSQWHLHMLFMLVMQRALNAVTSSLCYVVSYRADELEFI